MEAGTGLGMAARVRQAGNTSRSLIGAVCESRINWWAAYATDFSCPCIFAYLGMQHASSWLTIIFSSLSGLFLFSFIEYAVHRWLLHDPRSALFYLHSAHHKNPENTSAFLFPTSFLLLMPVWSLLTWGLHFQEASYFLMGLSGGYFYFDTLHLVEHTMRIRQIPFRWLKKKWAFHSVHHRIDRSNFGVTTPFWDYVFGTHQNQIKRRQSRAVFTA
jgi:sterol desaturase/sphingolipid hydroxylase (fatty acid hydroxylase superfamily)